MQGNTRNLHRADTYERVDKLFTTAPTPRGKNWASNQRPLGSTQQYHYRIERGPHGAYYDVCLYDTKMARLHLPLADGRRRVEYVYDDRVTSRSFMRYVLNTDQLRKWWADDGKDRYVPIAPASRMDVFSTELVIDADRRLVLAESHHKPIESLHANPALNEWKKELRERYATLFMLMEVAVEEHIKRAMQDPGNKRAFSSTNVPLNAFNMAKGMAEHGAMLKEAGVEALRELYFALASDRIARTNTRVNPPKWDYRTGRYEAAGNAFTAPTPSAVTTSVVNYIAQYAPYYVQRKVGRPLPYFPTSMPSAWGFV